MATKTKYSDFILEFDVLIDNDLNSECNLEVKVLKTTWMGGFTDTNVKLKQAPEDGRAEYMMKHEEAGYPLSRNEMWAEGFYKW